LFLGRLSGIMGFVVLCEAKSDLYAESPFDFGGTFAQWSFEREKIIY
jgi:hypothetical protein